MVDTINISEEEIQEYLNLIIFTYNYSPLKDIGKIIDSFKKEYGDSVDYNKVSKIVLNNLK
jgi:uncharacterized protein YqeY